MSTKYKNIEELMLTLSDKEKNDLVEEYSFKYRNFKEISATLIASMLKDIILPKDSSLQQVKSTLDKELFTYLCILIRNLNKEEIIDEILNFYNSIFEEILIELGYQEEIETIKRKILLELVYDYVGQSDFISMYARYAVGHIKHSISKEKMKIVIKKFSSEDYNEKVEEISLVGNKLNILSKIELDNPNFIKFVILKFGYNGYYLDNESIKKVLSLTDEEYESFLEEALKTMSRLAKDDSSEPKKYIK